MFLFLILLIPPTSALTDVSNATTPAYQGNDGYDDSLSYDPDDYGLDYNHQNVPSTEDVFKANLTSFRPELDSLFKSSNETQELIFEPLEDNYNYWTLDQAFHEISSRLASQRIRSQKIKTGSEDALNLIKERMDEYINKPGSGSELYKKFLKTRGPLDCAFGRKKTNQFFMKASLYIDNPVLCSKYISDMWYDLQSVDFSHKKCTLKECVTSLLQIDEDRHQSGSLDAEENAKRFQIKLDLICLLSANYDLLFKMLCPGQSRDTRCLKIEENVCKPTSAPGILRLSQEIQRSLKVEGVSSSDETMEVLNMLTKLGEISNSLSAVSKLASTNFGKTMLDNYMSIVDTAIGASSVASWKKTPANKRETQFNKILLNSEKYVGLFSKMILSQGGPTINEINKTALSIKMGRYSYNSTHNTSSQVSFFFDGAEIWTDPFHDEESKPDDNVYVYALHYNSLKEVLEKISPDGSQIANETYDLVSKFLIGKGGVISITAANNNAKRSVPVSYKIKFANESFIGDKNSVVRRCLSCEYLTDDKQWASNGCHVTSADDEGVTCHCNHTTNFAAFMMPHNPEYNVTKEQQTWLNVMEYVGSSLSVVCLLASLTVFCLVKKSVRNDRLKAHIHLVIALLMVHLIQLGVDYAVSINYLCILAAIATHFFLLAAFMWMLVEGMFLYLYVVQVFIHSKFESRRWMYVIGWCVPALIVTISATYGLANNVYLQPDRSLSGSCGENQLLYPPIESRYASCWLDWESGMVWSFIAPALLVILFNFVILCKVIQVLMKLSERSKGMKPFNSQHQFGNQAGYANSAYRNQTKQNQNAKTPSVEFKRRPSEPFTSSIAETDDIALHGSVITSRSHSRSSSQVYLQNRVLERPRNASPSILNDRNYMSDISTAVKGAMVLLPLLGIPWISGMLGYKSFALTIIFVLLNSVQGVAIFLVYCVFNSEVRRSLQRHLQLYRISRDQSKRGRTNSTSSLKSAFNRGLLRNWRRRSTAVSTLSNHI